MKKIVEALLRAVQSGQSAVLCSILASSGSSPRGAGAKMAVLEDGTTVGTVGGGAVELAAIRQAMRILEGDGEGLRAYCLSPGDVRSVGMICGGEVSVVFQKLTGRDEELLLHLQSALQKDENSWLILRLENGRVAETGLCSRQAGMIFGSEALLQSVRLTAAAQYVPGPTAYYAEPLVRAGSVYLFGGGHVGRALVPVLSAVGFRVTVFDDRKELAVPETYPQAERVIFGSFEDIFAQIDLTAQDYAVVMTPGHQSDREVLRQVLTKPCVYVGAIGSRRKAELTNAYLRECGIPEERIAAVHCPIGLSIGAQTPEEIAVSVAAEMILCRSLAMQSEA